MKPEEKVVQELNAYEILRITGRSGAKHEFDVFYEVKIAGMSYKVGIATSGQNVAVIVRYCKSQEVYF